MNIIVQNTRRSVAAVMAIACFFTVTCARAATAEDRNLRDSLFALRAQIQGYEDRISQSLNEVKTVSDAQGLMDMRRKKLSLEKALTQNSIDAAQGNIADINRAIASSAQKIASQRIIMAELLRDMDHSEKSNWQIFASGSTLSSIFDAVRNAELVHNSVRETVRAVREEQGALAQKRNDLEKRREEAILYQELQMREEFALQEEIARQKALHEYAGKRTQIFQDLLRRSELATSSLQQEFFDREGVGKAMPFAEAWNRADAVAKQLGIRTALLLALVAQESRFGEHQGSGNWKDDMHPSQWAALQQIAQGLGLDLDAIPVSKKPDYGWGGALGPAQFLPSTWLIYEDGIRRITGHTFPSPWNIDDAFAGAALKLAEAGATSKTAQAERKAALMYFAGENWDNPAFGFYADSILELAQEMEAEMSGGPKA
jgi:membrane-bound lytic murein transglycosylase B